MPKHATRLLIQSPDALSLSSLEVSLSSLGLKYMPFHAANGKLLSKMVIYAGEGWT